MVLQVLPLLEHWMMTPELLPLMDAAQERGMVLPLVRSLPTPAILAPFGVPFSEAPWQEPPELVSSERKVLHLQHLHVKQSTRGMTQGRSAAHRWPGSCKG